MTMSEARFQLATLLKLRESTRDECRARLAESQRVDQELVDQLTRLGMEQQRVQVECRKAAGPGDVDIERLVESHRYAVSLRNSEEELKQQRQTLAAEIQQRRQALLQADQEVQVLEKLRDQRLERHRVEEERKEAKQIDEAALQAAVS
jgi:flagellar export protein FliJ